MLVFLGKDFSEGLDPSGIVLLAFVKMELSPGDNVAIICRGLSLKMIVRTVR